MFAMRLPNEADKAIIRSALGDSSATVLDFLSSLADQEAIAFGEAIPTPMRMKFSRSDIAGPEEAKDAEPIPDAAPVALDRRCIVSRLRGDTPA
jgi:hypothetical protein